MNYFELAPEIQHKVKRQLLIDKGYDPSQYDFDGQYIFSKPGGIGEMGGGGVMMAPPPVKPKGLFGTVMDDAKSFAAGAINSVPEVLTGTAGAAGMRGLLANVPMHPFAKVGLTLGSSLITGTLGGMAKEAVLPESVKEMREDLQEQAPGSFFAGSLASPGVAFRSGGATVARTGRDLVNTLRNPGQMSKELQNNLINIGTGVGGNVAGEAVGQIREGEFNPGNMATAAGAGLFFNDPRRWTQRAFGFQPTAPNRTAFDYGSGSDAKSMTEGQAGFAHDRYRSTMEMLDGIAHPSGEQAAGRFTPRTAPGQFSKIDVNSRGFAGADTPMHELFHEMYSTTMKYGSPSEKAFIERLGKALGDEETAAGMVGEDAARRLLSGDKGNMFNDLLAMVRYKFGSEDADVLKRLASNMLLRGRGSEDMLPGVADTFSRGVKSPRSVEEEGERKLLEWPGRKELKAPRVFETGDAVKTFEPAGLLEDASPKPIGPRRQLPGAQNPRTFNQRYTGPGNQVFEMGDGTYNIQDFPTSRPEGAPMLEFGATGARAFGEPSRSFPSKTEIVKNQKSIKSQLKKAEARAKEERLQREAETARLQEEAKHKAQEAEQAEAARIEKERVEAEQAEAARKAEAEAASKAEAERKAQEVEQARREQEEAARVKAEEARATEAAERERIAALKKQEEAAALKKAEEEKAAKKAAETAAKSTAKAKPTSKPPAGGSMKKVEAPAEPVKKAKVVEDEGVVKPVEPAVEPAKTSGETAKVKALNQFIEEVETANVFGTSKELASLVNKAVDDGYISIKDAAEISRVNRAQGASAGASEFLGYLQMHKDNLTGTTASTVAPKPKPLEPTVAKASALPEMPGMGKSVELGNGYSIHRTESIHGEPKFIVKKVNKKGVPEGMLDGIFIKRPEKTIEQTYEAAYKKAQKEIKGSFPKADAPEKGATNKSVEQDDRYGHMSERQAKIIKERLQEAFAKAKAKGGPGHKNDSKFVIFIQGERLQKNTVAAVMKELNTISLQPWLIEPTWHNIKIGVNPMNQVFIDLEPGYQYQRKSEFGLRGDDIPKKSKWPRIFTGGTDRLRGTGSKEKAMVADAVEELHALRRNLRGKYGSQMLEATRKLSWSDQQALYGKLYEESTIRKVLRNEVPEHLKPAYDTLRRVYKQMREDQIAAGQANRHGEEPGIAPYDWFNMPSLDTMRVLREHQGSPTWEKLKKEFIEHNEKRGRSTAEAAEAFANITKGGGDARNLADHFSFKAVRAPHGFKLPKSWIEPDLNHAIDRYVNNFAKDRAFYDVIESNPELMQALGQKYYKNKEPLPPELEGKINSVMQDPDVESVFRSYLGTLTDSADKLMPSVGRLVNTLILSGPRTRLTDLATTPFKALPYVPVGELPGFLKAMTSWRRMTESALNAKRTGFVHVNKQMIMRDVLGAGERMASGLDKISEAVTTYSGAEALEKASRILAQNAGDYIGQIQRRMARAGDKEAIAFLEKISKNWDKLPDEELATRIGQLFQGKYDITNLPAWMQDSPIAPFFAMMKWNVEQWNNFKKFAVEPLKRGNVAPLASTLVSGLAGGALLKEMRDALGGTKGEDITFEEYENAPDRDAANRQMAARLGMWAQVTGTMGIMSELTNQMLDVVAGRENAGFRYPVAEFIRDTFEKGVSAGEAIADGVGIEEVMTEFLRDWGRNNVQMIKFAQVLYGYADPESDTGKEMANRTLRRDMRMFETLHGYPRSPRPMMAPQYKTLPEREFEKSRDIGEMSAMRREILERARENAIDPRTGRFDRERFLAYTRRYARSNIPYMPSPASSPMKFRERLDFVRRTQGEAAALELRKKYMEDRRFQQIRSNMIPTR